MPVVITDKNGKITTVRKRVGGSPAASTAIAAPSLTGTPASKSRAFRPNKEQLKPENHSYPMNRSGIDPRFHQFLPHGNRTMTLNIKASDEEVYDALKKFSSVDDALCYLFVTKMGPPLSEAHMDEVESIASHDSEREVLMRNAYERRIRSYNFVQFHRRYSSNSGGPGNYLDAAQTQSIPSLEKTIGLTHAVYNGKVSLDDVMEVGVQAVRTGSRFDPDRHLSRLEKLKDGTADYTAKQLGTVLSKCKSVELAATMLKFLDEYGGDFASSIVDANQAYSVTLLCDGDDEKRDAVEYANKFNLEGVFRNHKQIFDLYKAGVDVDFAIDRSRNFEEYSVQQIIALNAGIASPVTDGWL